MPVRHILVVDDSKSARLMLRKMLQNFGMTVDTAESAEEALTYLHDRQPDAIFMDHTMPGMDGLTAVRQIKSHPAIAAIPIAMYTSRDEPAYLQEAQTAGAIGVLTKPAMTEALGMLLEQMGQAVDATQPPTSAPEPQPHKGAVSVEWVEKIVADKAEVVIYDAIESHVLPLLNDVIAKLRQEMEVGQTQASAQVTERICQEQFAAWQPPLQGTVSPSLTEDAIKAQISPLLDERLEAMQRQERPELEELVRNIATQVCKNQLHELSERLVRQLSERFTEAVGKAALTAREAAVDAARKAAAESAQEAAAEAVREASLHLLPAAPMIDAETENATAAAAAAAESAAHQIWAKARRDLERRIYWAAGCAAVVGIVAAMVM